MAGSDDVYGGLRGRVLGVRPSDLGVSESLSVYGAMMELGMGDNTATVVCFASGDASLYYSTGGGFIGGSAIPTVHAAAVRMVDVFADFYELLPSVESVDVPGDGRTAFVAITPSGLRSASAATEAIESMGTDFAPLYAAGQDVISAFRTSQVATADEGAPVSEPAADVSRRGRRLWPRRSGR